MLWTYLFILMTVLLVLGATVGAVFLLSRFHRFRCLAGLSEKHKVLSWVLAGVPLVCIFGFYLINVYTLTVVLIYLFIMWGLCDLGAFLIRRVTKKERRGNPEGAAALLLTAGILAVGWHNAHNILQTEYTLTTGKNLEKPLRIAMLADSHLGITLDGAGFAAQMERIQAQNPDLVIVAGDFVDDDSRRADMEEAAAALGRLKTTYGVYFAFGNHDVGYFNHRDFTAQNLRDALTSNGVVILEDRSVPVGDTLCIVGREDKSNRERKDFSALADGIDPEKYMIVLDHQPNDYANEANIADLVLSGHTHGGHVFPAGYIGLWIGANDRVYGHETRGAENPTDFIVTSGISGWAIPFKTGCISEYVIIDIEPTK